MPSNTVASINTSAHRCRRLLPPSEAAFNCAVVNCDADAIVVGERVTKKEVEIWDWSPTKDRQVTFEPKSQLPGKVWFAVDVEVRAEPTAEPAKLDQRAPIKNVSGRAWSPGIYRALRLLDKTLDVAWERVFIHPLTFN